MDATAASTAGASGSSSAAAPGAQPGTSADDTLYALVDGVVNFDSIKRDLRSRKRINVAVA